MHLQEFGFEVLVNDQPLPEYNLPVDESDLNKTCVSYVTDPLTQTKKYSDVTTYFPVINQGECYKIRIEAKQANPSNIIISRLYIDGRSDPTQLFHQRSSSRTRSLSTNFFKSSRASSKRLKVQNKNQYGKHGSIAICFFRGVIVDDNSLQNQPGLADRGSDNNENEDFDYTTEFDVKDANIQPATVAKIVNLKPIAELHLHYRSEDWLTNRGFSLPILSDVNGEKEEDVNLITDEENKVNELPKLSQVLTKIENNNAKQIDEPLEIEANGNDVNPKVNKNAKNSQELMEIDKLIAKETRRLNDISQEIMEFERKKKEDQNILKRARDEIDEIDKI
ncbi:1902_t:CDS:2 [Funneliformis mosseae]|uniref:1902_t:CDS:1 n=1 Tax=Funneliformis mosseae TaxID=27381 RepID=A0A9N9GJP8_FUNMO|nr:1902_t:CDS:2 [Funneliformis mosseae]